MLKSLQTTDFAKGELFYQNQFVTILVNDASLSLYNNFSFI